MVETWDEVEFEVYHTTKGKRAKSIRLVQKACKQLENEIIENTLLEEIRVRATFGRNCKDKLEREVAEEAAKIIRLWFHYRDYISENPAPSEDDLDYRYYNALWVSKLGR